ncbi:MAG: 50S ribosomal protein L9 [candidate division TM6 bacterium GW2011_GWF2_30_66]|jgi:large subunit ribosomal protein L9|nr:MAG: 50S ribosomal protein L9 [candidate division TM6 bacterium GW2011_GWF2_30_66]
MNVYLLKDIEKIGLAGQIIKVKSGFADNFLVPQKLAIVITPANEAFYKGKVKHVEHVKEVVSSKTSMLAEKIKSLQLKLKSKAHDGGKLYGAISASDIVDLLAENGISVTKSQVEFGKTIKSVGTYNVTIKLSSKLKPEFQLKVVEA